MATEYVDILDYQGNPTGIVKTKAEAHQNEDWHPGANAWIVTNAGDILLQKRAEDKELWPGKWDVSVGGHISAGENAITTLVRETQEELGVNIAPNRFEHIFRIIQCIPDSHKRMHKVWQEDYLVEVDKTEFDVSKLKLQKEEVSEIKFISYRELEAKLADNPSEFVARTEEYEKLLVELRKRYP